MLPLFNLVNLSSTLIIWLLILHHSSQNSSSTFAIHIIAINLTPVRSSNYIQRIMGQTISATQFFVYGKRHFTQYVLRLLCFDFFTDSPSLCIRSFTIFTFPLVNIENLKNRILETRTVILQRARTDNIGVRVKGRSII
jgi:hypothetical protein